MRRLGWSRTVVRMSTPSSSPASDAVAGSAAPASETSSGRPRSLADDLRRRSDDALATLLRLRPDLVNPVPADLRALAARATGTPSMLRALDGFDAFGLAVTELVARMDDPIRPDDVVPNVMVHRARAGAVADDADVVALCERRTRESLQLLHALGLLWGADDSLTMVRGCRDLLLPSSPEAITDGLIRPVPPEPADVVVRDADHVARSAAQNALDAVRLVEELCQQWTTSPPSSLRTGGLSSRDLNRVADALDVDPDTAALVIEVAYAAGLVTTDGAADPVFTTTTGFDTWEQGDIASRWSWLAQTWLTNDRVAGLVGTKDPKDNRLSALSNDIERSYAASIRDAILQELATLAEGAAVGDASLIARIDWRRPRRVNQSRHEFIMWTTREAATLGITGLGALTPHGRALIDYSVPLAADQADGAPVEDPIADALRAHLPTPVDHVILQPDLTAIAPGPLEAELAREMALLADVESTGGATVYRFSDRSVRRAFDHGRESDSILEFLGEISRTPVPQPLSYLVADVARRHGQLRVGTAASYIRCDDVALLDTVMVANEMQQLQLRRIAPTVVVTSTAVTTVIDRLHAFGLSPTAEGPDGAVAIPRGTGRRPTTTRSMVRPREDAGPSERLLNAAVRALRAGEHQERDGVESDEVELSRPLPARTPPSKTLATIRHAIDEGAALRIGYASSNGSTVERIIDPVRVNAGQITAYDHRGGDVRTFAVSRITGVEVVRIGAGPDEGQEPST